MNDPFDLREQCDRLRHLLDLDDVLRHLDGVGVDNAFTMHPEFFAGYGSLSGVPGVGGGAVAHDHSPSGPTQVIAGGALLATLPEADCSAAESTRLATAAQRCCAYLRTVMRPSGRLDLPACNHDGGPDTAFVVQRLAPALARLRACAPAGWEAVADTLADLLRRTAEGLLDDGGGGTPNHRWVNACALEQLALLLPDRAPALQAASAAWMAETPDIDAEGFFLERSLAMYDAICARSLLLHDRARPWPVGRAAALACLRRDLTLLNPDGTADTSLSHRQDQGAAGVPAKLAPCYLWAAAATGDDTLAGAAAFLRMRATDDDANLQAWWVQALVDSGIRSAPRWTPPPVDDLLPINGLWRWRQGGLAASAAARTERVLGLVAGRVRLAGLRIAMSYQGAGRFAAQELRREGDGIVLESRDWPQGPCGYVRPVARPVPADWPGFVAVQSTRGLRELPPPRHRLRVIPCPDGMDLQYDGDALPRVPVQIVLDFPAGGEWECSDCAFRPVAGQVIILRRGVGTWRVGADALAIDGGAEAHRCYAMRDAPGPGTGLVRVVIGLVTPCTHRLTLRWRRG